MSVKDNLLQIKASLPPGVTLVVVSKTHPVSAIQQAYETGHLIFGENKVQELVAKYEVMPKDIEWHLIGHLQTNKVKYIAPFVSLIHSVDSLKLLEEINKQAARAGRKIDCLLQIHIAQEETKFGLSHQECIDLIQSQNYIKMNNVVIRGLMGMASNTADAAQVRNEFRSLKQFFDEVKRHFLPEISILSMGMSSDYEIAIEEGSTMIRVGSSIFGARDYSV